MERNHYMVEMQAKPNGEWQEWCRLGYQGQATGCALRLRDDRGALGTGCAPCATRVVRIADGKRAGVVWPTASDPLGSRLVIG